MPRRKVRRGRPRLKYWEKKKFYREKYEEYLYKYESNRLKLYYHDREMYDPTRYNFDVFFEQYKRYREEASKLREYAKEKGKKYTSENIVNEMVRQQTYKFSRKQYQGIVASVKENPELYEQYNIDVERFKSRNGKVGISELEFKTSRDIFTEDDYKNILRAYYDFKEQGKKLGKVGKDLVEYARGQVSANFFDSP